jgi:hypothetical protein
MAAMNAPPRLRYRRLRFEITRDAVIPLSDDDREMEHSCRCIPVLPTDDPGWFVFDSSRDWKTVWAIPVDDDDGGAP